MAAMNAATNMNIFKMTITSLFKSLRNVCLSSRMCCHPGNMIGNVSMANDGNKSKMAANIATTNTKYVNFTIMYSVYLIPSDIPMVLTHCQFDSKNS